MTFGLQPFGTAAFALDKSGFVTTYITPPTAAWGWAGNAPGINRKTHVSAASSAWGWSGNAPTINQKTIISPPTSPWHWIGNPATGLGGETEGFITGVLHGLVRGAIRGISGAKF